MRYRRKKQLTIILILVAVITSISIGFAAFSTNLNIASSANVTPNSNDFSVVFSSDEYTITTNDSSGIAVDGIGTNGATGGISNLYRGSASGLIAQLTEPGQSLSTTIYAHNIGEYDAYLRDVTISNIDGTSYKKCTGSSDATNLLVQSACAGINIFIAINGTSYSIDSPIARHVLAKGSVEPITITVSYDRNASHADGNFDVEFGEISLEYSTVAEEENLITFTVLSETFTAVEGMTWNEFVNSSYNINNRFTIDPTVKIDGKYVYDSDVMKVEGSSTIIANGVYV